MRVPSTKPTAPVDWPVAARVAGRLSPPGPPASRADLVDLVAGLRAAAGAATAHAARITGLTPADGTDPQVEPVSKVQVVDRAGWAAANVRLIESLSGPLVRELSDGKSPSRPARLAGAVEVGGVLGLLSGKVLGQFDPFTADATAPRGRLLLVAPNVLQVERAMGVVPEDFRLWVALHEQTHALQFAAAPWLAGHLRERASELLADVGRSGMGRPGAGRSGTGRRQRAGRQDSAPADVGRPGRPVLGDLAQLAVEILSGRDNGNGVLDLLTPEQQSVLDEVGAVMSLLEGHADVFMDAVGRSVVPSVRQIRSRFEARRDAAANVVGPQRVLRRLLGLDAKLAQYRDGAAFVREVRRSVGVDGLNLVWTSPDRLPTSREIADPRAWVRRVHG